MVSQDEFRALKGHICPVCGSTAPGHVRVVDDEWRQDGNYTADCQCACGGKWTVAWALAGYVTAALPPAMD